LLKIQKRLLMVKEVLLTDISKNIKTPKLKENFLLSLLKNAPEEFQSILKELKISKEEIIKIIKKEPPDIQKILFENLNSINIQKDTKIDLEKNTNLTPKKTKKEKIKKILNTLSQEIPQTQSLNIISNPSVFNPKETSNKEKILNLVKKEILSKTSLKEFKITNEEIKTIKNISPLKELITFAQKKDLNITKIIAKVIKKETVSKKSSLKEDKKNQIPTENILTTSTSLKNSLKKTEKKEKIPQILTKLFNNQEKSEITHTENKNIKTTHPKTKPLFTPLKTENSFEKEIIFNNEKEKSTPEISLNTLLSQKKPKTSQIQHSAPEPQTSIIQPEIKHQIIKAKESIKKFATYLKESIQNYKPPVSKVSIELHPKELGKVELTLIHRGENLQIHINSNNTSTIHFFNTNQNELKNVLINMGYSEVNMSFNSNQQNQQKQQYRQNQEKFTKKEDENSFLIEIPYTYA